MSLVSVAESGKEHQQQWVVVFGSITTFVSDGIRGIHATTEAITQKNKKRIN
jgi:hypothetical protein